MNATEIVQLCTKWKTDRTVFPTIVQEGVKYLNISQRELAEDFEVAESTVYRWASGLAVPHPKIQGLVVKWIKSRLSTSESRLGSASDSGTIPLAAKGK